MCNLEVCVCLRLILEFDLRTKEESGLLLYMARINHADFVSLQVSVYSSVIVELRLLFSSNISLWLYFTTWLHQKNSTDLLLCHETQFV